MEYKDPFILYSHWYGPWYSNVRAINRLNKQQWGNDTLRHPPWACFELSVEKDLFQTFGPDVTIKSWLIKVSIIIYHGVQLFVRHHDIIPLQSFPHCWPFVGKATGHRWISLTKSHQWGASVFSLMLAWSNSLTYSLFTGDLRCHVAIGTSLLWPVIWHFNYFL